MQLRVTSLLTRLLFFVVVAPAIFAADKPSVPEWVRQAAAQSLPAYPPDTDAVVLLDEVTYTVTSPSDFVEHHQRAVKILRPSGEGEGNFAIHFRGTEKVLNLHGWSVDSSGH